MLRVDSAEESIKNCHSAKPALLALRSLIVSGEAGNLSMGRRLWLLVFFGSDGNVLAIWNIKT